MGGRSRVLRELFPHRLAVLLTIVYLVWMPEVTCLRTSPFIGKYTKEKIESVGSVPLSEVVPEVIDPAELIQAAKVSAKNTNTSPYQVGVVAKGSAEEADGEGSNSTTAKSILTGIPQIDYIHDPNLPRELNGYNLTNYPFYNSIPAGIDFKCDGLHDGFYASVPHKCQVYHHCLFGTRYDFLCANYTAFDQKTFICHFVSEVDCDNSPKYYIRNEALYKAASTTTTTTTTTTTPAPPPSPTSHSESSRGRVGGGKRRRPMRRRPIVYDYAEDDYGDEDYEEDDEEYSRPPPPRRRKKKPARDRIRDEEEDFEEEEYPPARRKQRPRPRPQSNRRPVDAVDEEDDFEDDPPEPSASGVGLVPVGTSASRGKGVFDRPRAPPKIRPPVPINEREKYNYGRNGASSASTSGSASSNPSSSSYSGGGQTSVKNRDYSEDDIVERREKKRPSAPSKSRDDYYEYEEEDEEYERIPPPRGNLRNRRRKGQNSRVKQEETEDDYDYDSKDETTRDTDRYSSPGRKVTRRRKRPQGEATSSPVRRRRPGYRREEEDYDYEEEDEVRVRPTSSRHKDTYSKDSEEDEYRDRDRYPSRPRGSADAPATPSSSRKRVPVSRVQSNQERSRPTASTYNSRKRLPPPVHEEVDEGSYEDPVKEEAPFIPKERPVERVRVVKQRVSTTTTTTTTTTPAPPAPPVRSKFVPRTTPPPPPPKQKDLYEDDDYYELEEESVSQPKPSEPTNSRRPYRPNGPTESSAPFVGSGRSLSFNPTQASLPRGLQPLGDRAQKKELPISTSTPIPKPTENVPIPTVSLTTQKTRLEESVISENRQKFNSPQSYKLPTQLNARQQIPKQEPEIQPQESPFSRQPYISNARPGYNSKPVPVTQFQQKPPSKPPADSVPNHTDYEEDDFINDALHPTIPSSSGFPPTGASTSLVGRHGLSLRQQQRTTLSTPTEHPYRFRNAPQSSNLQEYRSQPSTPSFVNRGAPLYQSASHQTLSIVQPPQFISQPTHHRNTHNNHQTLYYRQSPNGFQGMNSWSISTPIVVQ